MAAVMLGAVTVATWGRGESEAAPQRRASGADLFSAKGCATCHTGPDTQALFEGFPRLDDVSSWAGDRKQAMSADDYLAESMAVPASFISPVFAGGMGPTSGMPQLRLTSEEIAALVAYLLGG